MADKLKDDAPEPIKLPPLPKAPEISKEQRQQAFRWFFFGVFALLLYQLLRIMAAFGDPILWAATLSLIFFPMHKRIAKRLGNDNVFGAMVSTSCVLLLVLIPLLILTWVVVAQSAQLYPVVRDWIVQLRGLQDKSIDTILPGWAVANWLKVKGVAASYGLTTQFDNFDMQAFLLRQLNTASRRIADLGGVAARNTLLVVYNLAIIVVGLFFCFKDGESFVRWFMDLIPMQREHVEAIGVRVYTTLTAIVHAALVTAAVQGGIAAIGYLIAGVPLAILFGVATGLAAMIPVVGAALFWVPIGVFMLLQDPFWGVFVFLWGFFAVSLIDNLLKPILIGAGAKMHILLMFFAILGGVQVYGVTGLVLGPVLIASFLAMVRIYREEYASKRRKPA